jgi:dihydrofolate reductase
MRKIIAGFAASVDGYIEGQQGEYDWILMNPEIDFAEQMKRFGVYLYGRKTYEMITKSRIKPVSSATHYVVSNTLTDVAKGYTLINGDIKSQLRDLKQQDGKDIAVFGGALLLASLLDLQLVDEISIVVIPVLLGSGKPMVALLKEKVWLEYATSKTYRNGTVQLTYNVIYKTA